MTIPIAILVGIAIGSIAVLVLWSRSADSKAIEAAKQEDAAYMLGYYRGKSGKEPQRLNLE